MPVFVKAAMWICVAALYVAQTSPVFFRMYNGGAVSALVWVGIAVSAGGLLLEAVADKQKSAQKAVNPDKVAMAGLYRVVRCPNYLGEIIFWTGLVLSSLDTLRTAGQWITVAIGYICIIIVIAVSLCTEAPSQQKIQGLVFGTSTPEQRAATRASWTKWDVINSIIILGITAAFYWYFW